MMLRPLSLLGLLAAALALCGCQASGSGKDAGCTGRCLPVSFPDRFDFGFATVAYQSEGSTALDGGRVQSNWAEWEDLGKTSDGQKNPWGNGFRDGYARDLDLSASLGAGAFSYAIDWARIEPERGRFDEAEVARTVALVKAIRARGLKPLIVLFHWVAPSWVQSPVTGVDLLAQSDSAFVDAFVPFVQKMVPLLAADVDDWVTFEEPFSIVLGEYLSGQHPPGHVLDMASTRRALVNLAYLHARTYRLVHQLDTEDADGDGVAARVGFENLAFDVVPLHADLAVDVKSAQRIDYIVNHEFIKAVWDGDIDLDMDGKADNVTLDPPERHDDSLAHSLDFIGINYYQKLRVEKDGLYASVDPILCNPHFDVRDYDATVPHSDMYQEFSAEGLRHVIEAYSRYGLPLVVSENGLADADDDQLPGYLVEQLAVIGKAIADGYDVRGYYFWTISDNFEWFEGRAPRFGIFRVDWNDPNFARTRTPAADVFEAIARGRRVDDGMWKRWSVDPYPVGLPP